MLRKLLSLLGDALVYGASSAVSQIVNLLLLKVFTQYLVRADFGALGMLAVVAGVFEPLARLGMTNAIFRRFNQAKDPETRRAVLATGLCSVLASTATLLLAAELAAPLIARVVELPSQVWLVRIGLLTAALSTISGVPIATLRAERRVRTIAVINLNRLFWTVGMSLYLVTVAGLGVRGVVLATLLSEALVCTALVAWAVRRYGLRIDRAAWRAMAAYGLPFVPHHVQAALLASYGQFVVAPMLGIAEAGLYNVASKFSTPLMFVVGAVQTAWVPYKFQIHADDHDPPAFFRSAVTYYVAGIAYLWMGVSVWGPEVLRWLTVPEFHAAAGLIAPVALVGVATGLYYMLGTGIEFAKSTKSYPLVSLAGLVTVVASSAPLIGWAGAAGAALATVLGWGVMAAVVYGLAQRHYRVRYDWPSLVLFLCLASAAVAASAACQSQPPALRLVVGAGLSLAYPLLAYLVLASSATERERMMILLGRLTRRRRPVAP